MSTTFIFGGDIRGIAVQRYLTLYFAVFCTWESGQPCLTKLEVGHHELKDRPFFVLVKNDRLVCGEKALDVLKEILPEHYQNWQQG